MHSGRAVPRAWLTASVQGAAASSPSSALSLLSTVPFRSELCFLVPRVVVAKSCWL